MELVVRGAANRNHRQDRTGRAGGSCAGANSRENDLDPPASGETGKVRHVAFPSAPLRIEAVARDRQRLDRALQSSERATLRQCANVVPRSRAARAGLRTLSRSIVAFFRAFRNSCER